MKINKAGIKQFLTSKRFAGALAVSALAVGTIIAVKRAKDKEILEIEVTEDSITAEA
jgi:hypothetical protein